MHSRPSDWQQALREAYRDPRQLLQDLELDPAQIDWLEPNLEQFPMRVPKSFAARMRPKDPHDPLLLQVLPLKSENLSTLGYVADPLQEAQFQSRPGLIQKYAGRALLISTGACGVHCRYCFRREFPYADASRSGWDSAIQSLREDASIQEIILSGGDPLSLSDAKLTRLIEELESISHLKRLRIHTRQTIVLPERITPALLSLLANTRLQSVMVVHSNHPNEINNEVADVLQKLHKNGIRLLNQSVFLKRINDDPAVLAELSERLFAAEVLPYYIHQLDPVQGAAHFALADSVARGIMQELNGMLPGYMVPRLVREVPGANGKLPLSWSPVDEPNCSAAS